MAPFHKRSPCKIILNLNEWCTLHLYGTSWKLKPYVQCELLKSKEIETTYMPLTLLHSKSQRVWCALDSISLFSNCITPFMGETFSLNFSLLSNHASLTLFSSYSFLDSALLPNTLGWTLLSPLTSLAYHPSSYFKSIEQSIDNVHFLSYKASKGQCQ